MSSHSELFNINKNRDKCSIIEIKSMRKILYYK